MMMVPGKLFFQESLLYIVDENRELEQRVKKINLVILSQHARSTRYFSHSREGTLYIHTPKKKRMSETDISKKKNEGLLYEFSLRGIDIQTKIPPLLSKHQVY